MSLSLRSTLFCLALALAACGTDIRLQPGLVDAGSDAQTASEPTSNGGAQDGGDQAEVDGASPITPDASRSPCDDSCSGDTPYCDVASDTCVACNTSSDCKDPQNSLCNAESKCEPCQGHGDCAHLPNTPLCHQQQCVACLPGARETCGNNVCDMVSQDVPVCAQGKAPRSAFDCQPCVSDEQCQEGQLCVGMNWKGDAVGHFCLWKQSTSEEPLHYCNTADRPYVASAAGTGTDAAGSTTVCTLLQTTCPAITKHRQSCGRFGEGESSVVVEDVTDSQLPKNPAPPASEIKPDPSVCGHAESALCKPRTEGVSTDPNGAYFCTVPCSQDRDCPISSTCKGATPSVAGYCSF